ncbi:MAG: glycoside hydrolase family 38 N-terminal domain-containing protein [Gemmatimonadaceae bacterium]
MDVLVVSHTHWDREWYHGAARFRQRLVPLVDELLDAPLPLAPSFLLDGQAVVVEDYLAMRPERRPALAAALRDGRLEAGPWYVLADELIPGGESLVRNLLAGRAALHALGATPPPVLYSPDAFGHAAAMPRLAQGFGFPVAIVWRGYGGARWPAGDSAWWVAPGGERVILHHLAPDGYESGANLPHEPDSARSRWTSLRVTLATRARLGVLFVPNGADHHALQRHARDAVDALSAAAAGTDDVVRWTSLREAAGAMVAGAATAGLPTVRGELRDSYGYTWALQGTFATRAGQKRRAARAERTLVRDVEPWLALSAIAAAPAARANLAAAWRTLLRCQPHDTLCGCSTDEVARAMDVRLSSAHSQAAGLRGIAMDALLDHDPVIARERGDDWRPVLVVRNPAPRARGGVAEVELQAFAAHVPVGPRTSAATEPVTVPPVPTVDGGRVVVQALRSRLGTALVESPRHYPDCDLVLRTSALAWVEPQDGYSVRGHVLGPPDADAAPAGPAVAAMGGERWLDNGLLRVEVDRDGSVSVATTGGRRIPDLLSLEDVADRGDCYTHSPAGRRTFRARPRRVRLVAAGPLRATLALEFAPSLPTRLAGLRDSARAVAAADDQRRVRCPIIVTLSLDAASDVLRIAVRGTNRARDHRLRLVVRTDVTGGETWADAAFGPLRREPLAVPPEDTVAEQPPDTAPLHRWVGRYDTTNGATVISDGLAEYEANADGSFALTLVRAVGQLSRADLPERPGHAGWPRPTPAAQCLGPIGGQFGLLLHGPRDATTLDRVERAADDLLLPLRGDSWRSALGLPERAGGATLTGGGLAMGAIKPADDPSWRLALRCVNLLDQPVAGAWTLGVHIDEARLARLDETPGDRIDVVDGTMSFTAPPRGVVTIVAR